MLSQTGTQMYKVPYALFITFTGAQYPNNLKLQWPINILAYTFNMISDEIGTLQDIDIQDEQ